MAKTAETSSGLKINRDAIRSGLYWLAGAFAAAIAVFSLVPQLDIVTSAMFGSYATGFPLRPNVLWEDVRQFFIIITNGAAVLLFGSWLVLRMRAAPTQGQGVFYRIAGFCALAYLLIPGVLVNGVIKPLWGRARPYNTDVFGGTFGYTSPFQLGGQCHGSCSFVSGETSALFTCATLAVLFLVPIVAAKWRVASLWGIWGPAAFGSLLRVVVGAHFLSDVVFSAILSTATVLALALRFSAEPKLRESRAESAKITTL